MLGTDFELREYATVGRSLCSLHDWKPGAVVLTDAPALEWVSTSADAEGKSTEIKLPEEIEEIRVAASVPFKDENMVPPMFAFAAMAFLEASKEAQKVVLDMHAPDLPINRCSHVLYIFAEGIRHLYLCKKECLAGQGEGGSTAVAAELQAESSVFCPTTEDVVHAMMAAKVNSHRAPDGKWRLFPLASKLAHSCDPNLMYVAERATFVALRRIYKGELLSFSYVGGNLLLQSASYRQERLLSSHLFVCRCKRCSTADFSRQIACQLIAKGADAAEPCEGFLVRCTSPMLASDQDLFPQRAWRCQLCQREFSDEELKETLTKEDQLAANIRLLGSSSYKYNILKSLLLGVQTRLGRRHWMYASVCHHLSLYFKLMFQNGCREALHLVVAWSFKYLQCMEAINLEVTQAAPIADRDAGTAVALRGSADRPYPHMLEAAAIVMMAQVAADVPKYRELLFRLSTCAHPLICAIYGQEDPRVAKITAIVSSSPPAAASSPSVVAAAPAAASNTTSSCPSSSGFYHDLQGCCPPTILGDEDALFIFWDKLTALLMWRQYSQTTGVTTATPGLSSTQSVPSVDSDMSLSSRDPRP